MFQKLSRVYQRDAASFDDIARVLKAAAKTWRDSSSNLAYFLRECSQWGTTELLDKSPFSTRNTKRDLIQRP